MKCHTCKPKRLRLRATFLNCLYFVCAGIIYVRTQVKITGQWKYAFSQNIYEIPAVLFFISTIRKGTLEKIVLL